MHNFVRSWPVCTAPASKVRETGSPAGTPCGDRAIPTQAIPEGVGPVAAVADSPIKTSGRGSPLQTERVSVAPSSQAGPSLSFPRTANGGLVALRARCAPQNVVLITPPPPLSKQRQTTRK